MGVAVHLPIASPSSDVLRSRRKRDVRKRTVSIARMTQRDLTFGKTVADAIYEELGDVARPKTRGDCLNDERPCPFISCKHHLYLDVQPMTGAIVLNFPDVEPDALEELPATCALDVADRDGETLEAVGEITNLTRERVRQIEVRALSKMKRAQKRFPAFAEQNQFRDENAARALEKMEGTFRMSNTDRVWAELEAAPASKATLIEKLGLGSSAVHNVLQTLRRQGKVVRYDDGNYCIIGGAERDGRKKPRGNEFPRTIAGVVEAVLPDGAVQFRAGPLPPSTPPSRFRMQLAGVTVECESADDAIALIRAMERAS